MSKETDMLFLVPVSSRTSPSCLRAFMLTVAPAGNSNSPELANSENSRWRLLLSPWLIYIFTGCPPGTASSFTYFLYIYCLFQFADFFSSPDIFLSSSEIFFFCS